MVESAKTKQNIDELTRLRETVPPNVAERAKPLTSLTNRILAAAGVLGLGAGVFAVGYFDPVSAGFFPVCPLHQLTGLNCPGCGMTRGFHALFNGDIGGALHFNAILPIFAVIFVYLLISLILTAIRGRGLSWKVFSNSSFLWTIFIALIVFGIVRNLPFYPFNLLAI